MNFKFAKDHLPWVVPSVAIILAASGFFDRSSNTEQVAQAPAAATFAANAPLSSASASSNFTAEDVDVVTRLDTSGEAGLDRLQPSQASLLEQAVARSIKPEVIAPQPAPVAVAPVLAVAAEPTRTAALGGGQVGSDFFAQAQAKLAAQESCIGDLRELANQARVYFPAGGLTADSGGIEQARLIATLVQDCAGVQIIVEGHSDPSGDPLVNRRLSEKRAQQVIQRLGASGLDTSSFLAQGLGSDRPSGVTGTESAAYYDRRVEFVVIETQSTSAAVRSTISPSPWANSSCVTDLKAAIEGKHVIFSPRSIAAKQADVGQALELAQMATACPNARLRVIGQHTDDLRAGENPATGRLRAKAMMAMLVGQGIDSGQIIIAAPSRASTDTQISGSRLDFDVILD